MKANTDEMSYARMGMAAMLPGMVHLLELMQAEVDRFRQLLEQAAAPKKRLGRPPKESYPPQERSSKIANYWAGMTPAERKREMKRRQEVAAGKRPSNRKPAEKKLHPRDAGHPGHAAWLKKMRTSQKKAWNKLTPAQREERQNKMLAGRGIPVVVMDRKAS